MICLDDVASARAMNARAATGYNKDTQKLEDDWRKTTALVDPVHLGEAKKRPRSLSDSTGTTGKIGKHPQ